MSKNKKLTGTDSLKSVKTTPPYFDPSHNWLKKETARRIIDLSDDQVKKDPQLATPPKAVAAPERAKQKKEAKPVENIRGKPVL